MNLFRLKKRACYLLTARHKRGYGIHSPFLYELITEVFRNKRSPSVVITNEKLSDCQFGHSAVGTKQRILYNMARALGKSAVVVCGKRECVDAHCFMAGALEIGAAQVVLDCEQEIAADTNKCGAIFLNGTDTGGVPLQRCFENIKRFVGRDTVLIVDNIDYSKSLFMEWKGLTEQEGVSLVVDACSFGMIFFNKALSKEYRVVRV